jgi:thiamine biosynthesis lipoprotein
LTAPNRPGHRGGICTTKNLVLDAATRTVSLPPGGAIDCGGFVKGWAIDRALDLLPSPCAVNAGGDARMRTAGPDGAAWKVAVEDPERRGRPLMYFEVRDQAVATSGISRRRWWMASQHAHHLIDPFTQRPSESELLQVTVVAWSAELADVLAKVAFLRGLREGERFLDRFGPPVSGIFVLRDGRVYVSGGLEVSGDAPTTLSR